MGPPAAGEAPIVLRSGAGRSSGGWAPGRAMPTSHRLALVRGGASAGPRSAGPSGSGLAVGLLRAPSVLARGGMTIERPRARAVLLLVALAALACGGKSETKAPPQPIARDEGTDIGTTGWRWIPFVDSTCTNADYTTSTTGLAISWGAGTDLVVFLAGGGACWDYLTCSAGVASTGPFGPTQFEQGIFGKYPNAWVHRDKLPAALADATIVFVPYCTGDVHTGDKVTTYTGFGAPITWHHYGRRNLLAFLARLGPTFPSPGKLVVAGSSAGGFGSLANYPAFKSVWPGARSYLIDDSGPPLVGDAIPAASRSAWYASWNMGAALGFCPDCQTDMSAGMKELKQRYPEDRIALLSHNEDET